jgi:hypothetical protein
MVTVFFEVISEAELVHVPLPLQLTPEENFRVRSGDLVDKRSFAVTWSPKKLYWPSHLHLKCKILLQLVEVSSSYILISRRVYKSIEICEVNLHVHSAARESRSSNSCLGNSAPHTTFHTVQYFLMNCVWIFQCFASAYIL